MAKQVQLKKGKTFVFSSGKSGGAKYPWAQWLDGTLWLLEQSTGLLDEKGNVVEVTQKGDFDISVNGMISKLKGTATMKRGKVVQISRTDADGNKLEGAIIIQARDMTADELATAKTKLAERDAKSKARMARKKAEANGTDEGDESE